MFFFKAKIIPVSAVDELIINVINIAISIRYISIINILMLDYYFKSDNGGEYCKTCFKCVKYPVKPTPKIELNIFEKLLRWI